MQLFEDENLYHKIKSLIFIKCITEKYLKMQKKTETIYRNISDSVTILILSGIFHHWNTIISDLIKQSYMSMDFCDLTLRALGDIDIFVQFKKETDDSAAQINEIIHQKERYQIKDKLIENKDIVINFIMLVYKNINIFNNNEKMKLNILTSIIDIIKCWTFFDLNLLKTPTVYQIVYSIIKTNKIKNLEKFYEMCYESILSSKNAKIHTKIDYHSDLSPEILSQKVLQSMDIQEKQGIYDLLNFITDGLSVFQKNPQLINNDSYFENLFTTYAQIFSCIIENYIYLFFNFNERITGLLLQWFKFFLTYKNKKISCMFFEGLNEMRDFVNNYYKFFGLNNDQKVEFVNYLMDITFQVMENCAYRKLNQKDISQLEQEIICKSSSNITNNNNDLDNNDSEDDDEMNQYRQSADAVFYDIFLILVVNFNEQGAELFLKKLISFLPLNSLNDEKTLQDKLVPIRIDIVFYVFTAIVESFEIINSKASINILQNVIKIFTDSKIIFQNLKIFSDFLILVDKFSNYLGTDKQNFIKIIKLLLLVSDKSTNPIIIESCYIVMFNLTSALDKNTNVEELFSEVYERYKQIYSKYKYPNIQPLQYIINSLLAIGGISSNRIPDNITPEQNNNISNNLIMIVNQISLPVDNEMKSLIENLEKNKNDNKLKNAIGFEIIKGYLIHQKILSQLQLFSYNLRNLFLQEHLNKTLNLTSKIFDIFVNDKDIITPLIDFYSPNANAIGEICQNNKNFANLFNNIFLKYFLYSDSNFSVIDILKLFYLSILRNKNSNEYLQNNKFILEQYYLIMNKFIEYINTEKFVNSKLKEEVKIFSDFHYNIFPEICLNNTSLITNENLMKFLEITQKIINVLISSINLFKNEENKEPINELLIISIIKSFNAFIINKTLPNGFLINSDNNCLLSQIIVAIWNFVVFKQFNCISRNELLNFYKNSCKLDKNLFEYALRNCLIETKIFENNYINSIIEYVHLFGDDNNELNNILQATMDIVQGNQGKRSLDIYFMNVAKKKLRRVA